MGSTVTNVNDQFNQQWITLVNSWAGPTTAGGTRVIFPCNNNSLAPMAGNGIPEPVTNYAIYQIADNLLSSDDQWYTPGSQGSYFQNEVTYFNHIQLGGDKSKPAEAALTAAQIQAQKASMACFKFQRQAFKEWHESWEEEPTDFNTFLVNNCQYVLTAQSEMSAANAQVLSQLANVRGANAAQVGEIRARFETLCQNQPLTGYSFEASTEPFDIQHYIEQLQKQEQEKTSAHPQAPVQPQAQAQPQTQATANPTSTINLPAYWYQENYPTILDSMYRNAVNPNASAALKQSFTIITESSSSKASSGSSGSSTSVSLPWLSFNDGSSKSWSQSTVNVTAGKINVVVEIKAVNTISMGPGQWDVANYRQQYPDVMANTPASIKNAVKPIGMLIGQGLTMTVTFEGETKNAFNKEYSSTKENGGGISIFGISIGFGDGPVKKHSETHKCTYNHSGGVLTISPTPQLGTAMLLAVIGQNNAST